MVAPTGVATLNLAFSAVPDVLEVGVVDILPVEAACELHVVQIGPRRRLGPGNLYPGRRPADLPLSPTQACSDIFPSSLPGFIRDSFGIHWEFIALPYKAL